MHKIYIALAVAVLAAGPTAADEKTDVMVPVHQFVDGFNKGDTKTAAAACADQTAIIDEFPPHEWHGAGACSKWMNDYDADARKNGITDGIVTLSNPRHIDITADRAYVVVPANYTVKKKGKLVKETGDVYACPAKRRGRLAYHWMGMGEELGAAALRPNNKHQFAIWVAELINLYPPAA